MGQWLKVILALAAFWLLLAFVDMGPWEERAYQRAIERERTTKRATVIAFNQQRDRLARQSATRYPHATPLPYPTTTTVFANYLTAPLPLELICATRQSPLCPTPEPTPLVLLPTPTSHPYANHHPRCNEDR